MCATVHRPEDLPRLRSHEAIRAGLRRVLLRCVARAGAVADREGIASGRVHAGRVALKRARAVLRVAESAGAPWAAEARRRLARQAGVIAELRDAEVLAETARQLGAVVLHRRREFSWPEWRNRLLAEWRRLARCHWPVMSRLRWKAALADSIRRMHETQREAKRGAKPGRLHEWRKAVIVLREQLNVLQTRLTPQERKLAKRLHQIARRLGAVQDLSLVVKAERRRTPDGQRSELEDRARRVRRRAIKQARVLAAGLCGEMERRLGTAAAGRR
jgi:CHAD domain-containing protein